MHQFAKLLVNVLYVAAFARSDGANDDKISIGENTIDDSVSCEFVFVVIDQRSAERSAVPRSFIAFPSVSVSQAPDGPESEHGSPDDEARVDRPESAPRVLREDPVVPEDEVFIPAQPRGLEQRVAGREIGEGGQVRFM